MALYCALMPGCAGGDSDEVFSFGPPRLPQDDGDADDDGDASESGAAGSEGDEPFDDAGVSGGVDDAPADDAGDPPMDPVPPADDGAPMDDGAEPPPPNDDGGDPPPPPPPMGLEAQCTDFCFGLQDCGLLDDGQAAFDECMTDCALPISPACDDAWADVMTCVIPLDCPSMAAWWFYLPGYPCAAQDEAAANACG